MKIANGIVGTITITTGTCEINSCYNTGTLQNATTKYNISSTPTSYSDVYGLEEYYYYETILDESNIENLFIDNGYYQIDRAKSDYIILKDNQPNIISFIKSISYELPTGEAIYDLSSVSSGTDITVKINAFTSESKEINYIVCEFDKYGNLNQTIFSDNAIVNIEDVNYTERIEVFVFIGNSIIPASNSYYNCQTVLNKIS